MPCVEALTALLPRRIWQKPPPDPPRSFPVLLLVRLRLSERIGHPGAKLGRPPRPRVDPGDLFEAALEVLDGDTAAAPRGAPLVLDQLVGDAAAVVREPAAVLERLPRGVRVGFERRSVRCNCKLAARNPSTSQMRGFL